MSHSLRTSRDSIQSASSYPNPAWLAEKEFPLHSGAKLFMKTFESAVGRAVGEYFPVAWEEGKEGLHYFRLAGWHLPKCVSGRTSLLRVIRAGKFGEKMTQQRQLRRQRPMIENWMLWRIVLRMNLCTRTPVRLNNPSSWSTIAKRANKTVNERLKIFFKVKGSHTWVDG